MKKIVATFGLISGVLSAGMMAATVPFMHNVSGLKGYLFGYTSIVLSFLLVFFGIRSYRDNVGGGRISFGRGFAVGILITLISCAFYVGTWEVIYFKFMPHFMDNYQNPAIEKMRAEGASEAAVQAKVEAQKKFLEQYNNPMINAAMTLMEPFPVGLVITLVSAGILRRKEAVGVVSDALLIRN